MGHTLLAYWSLLPATAQRVIAALLRIALTVLLARLLWRLVPALERFVVRRARRIGARGRARVATDSTIDLERRIETLIRVVGSVARAVVGAFAAVFVLATVGLDIAPLIAGAGIAGLAVGFGAQSIVKDFISGFFILLENHYDVGDTVTVNSVTGTVEEMTLRVTVVRDTAGALHLIPNGLITTATNRTAGWLRASLDVTVPIAVDPATARASLEAAAAEANRDTALAGTLLGLVEVEGPLDFTGAAVTWRLHARARPELVNAARERLLVALRHAVPVDAEKGTLRWGEPAPPH